MAESKSTTPSSSQHAGDRTALYEWLLGAVEDEFGRLYALAEALERRLAPEDPKNPPDSCPINEWRLAEVLVGQIERNYLHELLRSSLLPETAKRAVVRRGLNA